MSVIDEGASPHAARGLGAFLERHKPDIIRAWRTRVVDELVPRAVPRAELINSLPVFLDEIIDALAGDRPQGVAPSTAVRATGGEHGKQRLHMGFDVAGVVREYSMLRECIFELAAEAGQPITLAEHRVLSGCIDAAVGEAVTQYAIERDEQLRKKTSSHIGFLAHELRNPLNSAVLALLALRDRGALRGAREGDILQRNLERLRALIDQTLVEGELQAGVDLRLEPTPVDELLRGLEAECAADAERRRIALRLECEGGLVVPSDQRYLHSALSNLVRNALKFSHEGGEVVVRARRGAAKVLIEVEDECGGLPAGSIEKLFNPFVQVGADRSGFGLGLAIAKQATEAHGGSLRVHDLPGKGCVFTLELPCQEDDPRQQAGAAASR